MNKIIVPKHVEAWLFDMWVDIWPFRVKMWQLFIIAVWVAIWWSIVSKLKPSLWLFLSIIIASPIFILALVIAFFRKSELYIIPFFIKLVRTYLIWTPRTFQKNIIKPADWEIKLHFARLNKWEEKTTEQKELKQDELEKNLETLNKW